MAQFTSNGLTDPLNMQTGLNFFVDLLWPGTVLASSDTLWLTRFTTSLHQRGETTRLDLNAKGKAISGSADTLEVFNGDGSWISLKGVKLTCKLWNAQIDENNVFDVKQLVRSLLSGNDFITGTRAGIASSIAANEGDVLFGFNGNDTLDGLEGPDVLNGGRGNDTYFVDNTGDVVIEALDSGLDVIRSSVNYVLPANAEKLILTNAAISGTGNELANSIFGTGGDNTLAGAEGNDTLKGAGGDDTLDGGPGTDKMCGGHGNDIFVVDSLADKTQELFDQGVDTVRASVNWTLSVNVERLILTGEEDLTGTGNALANTIVGNSVDNLLDGGLGADTISGQAGDDTMVWSAEDMYDGGTDTDTLRVLGAGITLDLTAVANSKLQNLEVIDITGSGNNQLKLAIDDVLDISSTSDTLRVEGDAGDGMQIDKDWVKGADQVIADITYFSFTKNGATLLIDAAVMVIAQVA